MIIPTLRGISERLKKLNQIAIQQMAILENSEDARKLLK